MIQRSMRPDDIRRVVVVEEMDVSPDGAWAVVVRRVVRRNTYESHLFVVDLVARRRPRRITDGRVRDSGPIVSPDGSTVAFLRSDPGDDDAPNQLCVVPISGGRVRTLAPHGSKPGFGEIGELAWSPDGGRLAFTAEVDPPIMLVGDPAPVGSRRARHPKPSAPTARRIRRTGWRWDERGHRDRWSHLFVLEATSSARPRQVTSGDWGVTDICWHPNGSVVAFVSDHGADPDVRPRTSAFGIDVDAGRRSRRSRPWPILEGGGSITKPAFSPDGRWLVAIGVLAEDPLDDVSPGLVLARSDGSGVPHELAPDLDRPVGSWCDTDLHGWMVDGRFGPVWLDESTIVAALTDRGRSLPERWVVEAATGSPIEVPVVSERLSDGPWADATTHALAVAPAHGDHDGTVAVLGTLAGRAMDVMTVDLTAPPADRRLRHHSTFGSSWQRSFVQPEVRRVEVPGAGGPVETWIASPPDAGDGPLPTIVDVHGGPLGGWTPTPSIEVVLLTGAGFRVVLPNIRGGAGYGSDWIRQQLGRWGEVDADDVHAAVDHVVDLGLADPERLGIMGLSYGGFMVNWMVGTTDRFAAAVSENGVTNQLSCWANSDCGPEYCRTSMLGDPFTAEGVDRLWQQSPLRHVANVRTPLLMLQAESDLRCPPQDNEQFFVALRHLGREVEYVLYPDESHVYAASGRPDRRIDRMQRVLDWFGRHLGTA